jgi:hypothetical protein
MRGRVADAGHRHLHGFQLNVITLAPAERSGVCRAQRGRYAELGDHYRHHALVMMLQCAQVMTLSH